jgi:uncharacterized protein YutE (UPF0331/DUF86 family)
VEPRVVSQKLESLRRCVQRIVEKTPSTPQILESNFDLQDIISVNLERAVQQCVDIAAHILADFDDVSGQSAASLFHDLALKGFVSTEIADKLSRAAGFRNLLVHRYATIDWKRVFESLQREVVCFSSFAGEIAGRIPK